MNHVGPQKLSRNSASRARDPARDSPPLTIRGCSIPVPCERIHRRPVWQLQDGRGENGSWVALEAHLSRSVFLTRKPYPRQPLAAPRRVPSPSTLTGPLISPPRPTPCPPCQDRKPLRAGYAGARVCGRRASLRVHFFLLRQHVLRCHPCRVRLVLRLELYHPQAARPRRGL